MDEAKNKVDGALVNGFSPVSSSTPVFWKSRKRSDSIPHSTHREQISYLLIVPHFLPPCMPGGTPAFGVVSAGNLNSIWLRRYNSECRRYNPSCKEVGKEAQYGASMKNLYKDMTDDADKATENKEEHPPEEKQEESTPPTVLSEKRKALFEPLQPMMDLNGRRPSAESLLPPPDFDSASYPRGWLIGKKRKLVNVDVVESMRRIAVQEMNRKDREIDGLNEQLEEDARVLEHLQLQLLEERSKRADVERQNGMLQNQVDMLMNMLQDPDNMDDEEGPQEP